MAPAGLIIISRYSVMSFWSGCEAGKGVSVGRVFLASAVMCMFCGWIARALLGRVGDVLHCRRIVFVSLSCPGASFSNAASLFRAAKCFGFTLLPFIRFR